MGISSSIPPLFPERPDFSHVWKQAANYDVKKERKVQSLSLAMDTEEETVRQNLPDYEALFAHRQLDNQDVATKYPTLYSNLTDVAFVAIARDDMGNVIDTEGWWNGVANAYAVSRDTVAIGTIGTRAMLDGRDLYPYERRKIEKARRLQRAHTKSQPGWVAAGAELLGTMQETLMYSLGAAKTAALISGPLAPYTAPIAGFTAAFASSFNLEAGNLYADLIMDGYTPAEAANIGYQYGALIAGFESLGMKGAGAGLRGLGRELMKGKGSSLFARKTAGKAFTDIILRDYLAKGVGGESLTEGIQEILAEHGKLRASELYRPDNLYEPEYWDTFWHTVGHTAKGMIVLGGIPAGTRLAMDTIRSAQSQHDGKKAREAVELRRNSKAPEAQEKVDAEAGETLESTYYVRAQDMMGSIRQAEKVDKDTDGKLRKLLNSKHKGIVGKLEEAERHDGEVKLSKNEWETVFAQGLERNFTDVAFQNVAFEEGGFTNAEAKAHEAAREKLMEEANEETKKALQDMDTFEEELREVRLEMREMLKGVVKGTSSELTLTAAHQATLLVGFIRRNALLMNIGPREYVEKHLPKIIQQNLDAKQAAQTQQQAEDRSRVLNAFAGTASNMTGEVKQRLQEAAKLAKQGKDAREIWKKTGWYIGPDGNPYYEINDQNVEVSPEFVQSSVGTSHSLKEVLNHPELFEAYPELGGIEIRYVTGQKSEDGGASGALGGVALDKEGVTSIDLNENLRTDPRLLKSVLMHEVQHAIQVQEQSRVQGGSVGYVGRMDVDVLLDRDYALLESSLSEAARAVEQDGKSIIQMFRDLYQGINNRTNSPSDQKKIRSSIQELADSLSESDKQHILESLDIMDGFYQTGNPDSKYKDLHYMVYQRLAGEVEARNMEARLAMTAEERRQSYPDDTADVPASRVILAVGPGTIDGRKVVVRTPTGWENFPGKTFSKTPRQRTERDIEARPVFENTDASNFDQDAKAEDRSNVLNAGGPQARNAALQKAGRDLDAGVITREEYDAAVDRLKPVTPYDHAPTPATDSEMTEALDKGKKDKLGGSRKLPEGEKVKLRLDIPAYNRHGIWVVTVKSEGATSYDSVAHVKNAQMAMSEKGAKKIALGGKKAPLAWINGTWVSTNPEKAKADVEAALNDPAWRQVGIDPERHSYFYDRTTGEPIVSADEVIQVGPLVLAKNATTASKKQFLYSTEEVPNSIGDWSHFPGAKEAAEGTREDKIVFAKIAHIRIFEDFDGVVYFEWPDGTVADSLVEDRTDQSWPLVGVERFMEETGATFVDTPIHEMTASEYARNQLNLVDTADRVTRLSELDPELWGPEGHPNKKSFEEILARYEADPNSFEGQAISEHADAIQFALSQGERVSQRVLESAKIGNFDQDANYTFTEADHRPEVVAWAKEKLGDRVAPNGKPVYQNFTRWFGDSKAVDAEGKPMVVFHGTSAEFSKFDRQAGKEGSMFTYGREPGSGGIFFSSTPSSYFTEGSRGQERGGRTIPAYVTIKNPAILPGDLSLEEQAKALREAEEQGHDGAIIGEVEYVVFDSNQIKSTNNKGNFSADENILESSEGDQKKTLGQAVFIDDVIKEILLDPDAKPTTLMHELTHWNLEMMATMGLDIENKIAQEGYEPSLMEAEMLGDIQRLIKWSGYKGTLKEWSAMSVEERRPFHEAVAVSFEIYLVEGKAPSRELRGVFERLLAYIGDTYKALVETFQQDYAREFGERREALGIDPQLPGLNPDVRAIFGRMLSASRDVDSFLDENELKTMMISKEDFVILRGGKNLDEEDRKALEAQWSEYHQEFEDAITRAKAELTIHRINEVKYQQRAYERIGKEIKREIKSATDIIRQQEEKALSLTSVYQYRSWINTGKYQTEEGERTLLLKDAEGNDIKNPKLDAEEVEAAAPQNAESLKKRKLTKKGGVPLEIVRKAFGFKDVKEMLQALAQSKTLKGEVNVRTDQRVREELTDLTDPVLMQERMQKAVHNNIRRRMVALELKYLLNNGRASKVETALAKKAAKEIIESTATGNIDISAYSRAAARARKKSLMALKDGDMEAAAFAKRQELLNESLVSEGLKAREEIRRLMKHNEKVFKPKSDKALGKAKHDVIVVKALRALLSHFGIGRVEGDAKEMLARLVKHDPTFYNQEAEQIRSLLSLPIAQPRVGDRRKPVEHLTLKQIRTLRMLSERFMHRSKQNIKSKIEGKKQTVKENQELATKALEDNVPVSKIDPDGRKSIFGRIRDWFSDLIRFEHLFRRADGGKESGIWTKMFRMVKDSGNAYRAEVRDFTLWFSESLKALDLKVPGGERALTFKVLDNEVVIGEGGLNVKSKLIHMAMHFYSNSSNRERLVRGYVGKHEDSEVDAQRMEQAEGEIRSFFNQQIQQGLLTKADFDFMQSVFSKLSGSDMLGRAQKVMMSHSNYEMDTIEGEEFSIPFPDGTSSTYAGGYIPVRYDRSGAKRGDVDQFEEDMSIDGQSHRMLSILPSFTKERTAPDPDPLDLNLSSIQHHAAEVYRFIHMTEPVTEVYKVINGEGVRKAFVQRFGAKAYNNMDGWLRRSAHQRFDKGDDTEVGKMMLALSRNANMAVMFLNIGNSLQNYAGLVIPMRRVGARGIISALISSSFSSAARKEIAAKSKEMAGRLDRQIFDIYATQQKLLTSEDGMWANVKGWTNRWAYVMQQYTQNHVDVAVWQAAYNQETAKALDGQASAEEAEARAVAYADSVVRGSQMAGEKEDLSHFESGGTALKAMFPFKSWFINWMNNAANQGRLDMSDADQGRMLALAQTYMYLLMLPSLLATAATKVAAGAEWGDDDEDFSDDMFEFWFRSQLDQVTGGLPVISDLKRMIEGNWLDDKHWNNRYPTTPWQRGLEKLVQGSAKGFDFDSTMGLSAQFADLAGLPISRAWNSASMIGDELAGDLRSEGTMDLIRGMATGKRSASQRL